ncbi:hypothetical protein TNCV_1388701 [Trichonephila clavipes]|nr:hypothetical protein TNCV_1388701 [Trichonephila clavipes]
MRMILEKEIGEIWKWCVDRVMARNDYRSNSRMVVKEIIASTAGIDFRRMIEDFRIGDTNLEMGGQKDDFEGTRRNRGSRENLAETV